MTNITSKLKINNLTVPLLTSGHLSADLYSGFLLPILPLIAMKLDISLAMAGLLITFSSIFSHFVQPLHGYFADRTNKRIFIISGLIIASISISFTGWANNYLLLLFLIVIGNLGVGLFHPQATAMVGKLDSIKHNSNMGIFIAGGIVGYAIGPMFSASLVTAFGLPGTIFAIIPGIVTAIILYIFLPKFETKVSQKTSGNVLRSLLEQKHIISLIVLIIILRAIIVISLSIYLPFEWENNLGYSVALVGIIMTVFSLVSGLSSVLGGKLSSRFCERNLLICSFLIAIPFLLTSILLMNTNGLIGCLLFIIGGAILQSTISINIVVSQRLLPQNLGVMSGITGGFSWGIAGIMMYPIGLLIQHFNTSQILSSIICLAILPVFLTLLLPKRLFNSALVNE